uniref:Mediator of RNA polymerase II transcription subunit 11 n=1 Tax=Geospiza parvula TaxID=87175 RepID=A0A8C3MCW6_GEOPR
MAGFGVANERLRALEELEREIGASLQSAGLVILELSKEKPQERHLDRQAAQFGAAVAKVEAELSAQIRYLTQVRPCGDPGGIWGGFRGSQVGFGGSQVGLGGSQVGFWGILGYSRWDLEFLGFFDPLSPSGVSHLPRSVWGVPGEFLAIFWGQFWGILDGIWGSLIPPAPQVCLSPAQVSF